MTERVAANLPIPIPYDAIAEFCERHHIRKLALFGSVLRDDFRPDSDVDVLVEFEPGRLPDLIRYVRMQRELGSLLARDVDLSTSESLSRHFRQKLLERAQALYLAG